MHSSDEEEGEGEGEEREEEEEEEEEGEEGTVLTGLHNLFVGRQNARHGDDDDGRDGQEAEEKNEDEETHHPYPSSSRRSPYVHPKSRLVLVHA